MRFVADLDALNLNRKEGVNDRDELGQDES